jgi:predicted Zn-dependent protease
MAKKRLLSIVLSLFFMFSFVTTAFAAASVSVWYSDKDYVSYTPYDGSYYIYILSSNSSFSTSFRNAVSRANAQWNAVLPIGVSETSFNYALNYVYGGTRNQLIDSFPDLSSSNSGLTYPYRTGESVTVQYNGSSKTVYTLQAGCKMCVVEISGRTDDGYKKTAIHEMGHLFGWNGHSSNSSDIMYGSASEITSLTTRDKTHLKQIYTLFY